VGCHARPHDYLDLPDSTYYQSRVIRNSEAHVFRLIVAPGARRGGVGSALMEAVEGFARERGARSVRAEAASMTALAFFGSLGYDLVHSETKLQGTARARTLEKVLPAR